jgi:uncharacterized protein YacL
MILGLLVAGFISSAVLLFLKHSLAPIISVITSVIMIATHDNPYMFEVSQKLFTLS